MGPYNHGEAFHPHDGAMQPFAPADFHEPHNLHQHYPTWTSMGMSNTHPPSLTICPETLDPALYPGELFQPNAASLSQHLPFPHGGPGELSFDQNYDDSWPHMPHPDVMPWQDASAGGAQAHDATTNNHIRDIPTNRPHTTPGVMHSQPAPQQHTIENILQERGLFGKMENKHAAGKIADKSTVKSILGNMQRMDSRYRNYAREHLLDMDLGTGEIADRTGRLHHMMKKRHRERNAFKKRKRGDLARG